MQDSEFSDIVALIRKDDARFDAKAYDFVRLGLDHSYREADLRKRDAARADRARHVTRGGASDRVADVRARPIRAHGTKKHFATPWGITRCGDFRRDCFQSHRIARSSARPRATALRISTPSTILKTPLSPPLPARRARGGFDDRAGRLGLNRRRCQNPFLPGPTCPCSIPFGGSRSKPRGAAQRPHPDPRSPTVPRPLASVQVWVKTGSIHEGANLGAGLSHYLEHMLFKGTERRSGREISAAVQAHGGNINAYTTFDRTVYHIDLPAEHVAFAVDLLADIVLHSTLPADEAAKGKRGDPAGDRQRPATTPTTVFGRRCSRARFASASLPPPHHRPPRRVRRSPTRISTGITRRAMCRTIWRW